MNTKKNNPHQNSKDSGFTFGMLLGAIFGGGSLFFFGTKTGKKIKNQLQKEFKNGGFEFESIKKDTLKKLENIIQNSNIESLTRDNLITNGKTKKSNKKKKSSSKKFFSNTK